MSSFPYFPLPRDRAGLHVAVPSALHERADRLWSGDADFSQRRHWEALERMLDVTLQVTRDDTLESVMLVSTLRAKGAFPSLNVRISGLGQVACCPTREPSLSIPQGQGQACGRGGSRILPHCRGGQEIGGPHCPEGSGRHEPRGMGLGRIDHASPCMTGRNGRESDGLAAGVSPIHPTYSPAQSVLSETVAPAARKKAHIIPLKRRRCWKGKVAQDLCDQRGAREFCCILTIERCGGNCVTQWA